jgi:TolB-like protein/DNA-binding winged helix-turn-helix (wHTH) protein/tetratricopeptide (TPR) repeat protein
VQTPSTASRGFRFGVFEFDPRAGELRRRGLKVRVRGRPLDILAILLERRPDLISREELRARLWAADTFVDFDHGLNAAVNRLRDALGDTAENPRFIETVPRKGYRFIAPVETLESSPDSAAPAAPDEEPVPEPAPSHYPEQASTRDPPAARGQRRRWVTAVVAGAVVAAIALTLAAVWPRRPGGQGVAATGKVLLVVLPFEDLSGMPDQEYFSDGLTEELIARLGALSPSRLGVIARTSAQQYKGAKKDIGQIGAELGVAYVLEGSVRRAGDRVRITAQLIQVADQTHLWAEQYDRDVVDVLGIQSEVAMKVVRSLSMEILDEGPSRAVASRVFPALEEYMRGRFYREQATESSVRRAITHFERAIELDPGYAAAHAALADCHRLLAAPGWEVERPAALLPRARAAAERALQIDPRLAEAHVVLAMLRFDHEWDIPAAERGLREALALDPNSARAHLYYSGVLTAAGRFDESIAEARQALKLDPMAPTAATTLGVRLFYARRYGEAEAQFRQTTERNPEFPVAHWGLAETYWQQGRRDAALAAWQRAVEASGGSSYMRSRLAYGLAANGETSRARQLLSELESAVSVRYVAPFHLGLVYAALGDSNRALDELERAQRDKSGWMMWLDLERGFNGVRDTPRFRALGHGIRR